MKTQVSSPSQSGQNLGSGVDVVVVVVVVVVDMVDVVVVAA